MPIWDLLQRHKEGSLTYQEGVALFFQLWPSRKYLESFFTKEDAHSRKILNTALTQEYAKQAALILPAAQMPPPPPQSNGPAVASLGPQKRINAALLPAELQLQYARLSPIIREIAHLRGGLFVAPNKHQRYLLADKIIRLARQRRAIFNQIDAWQQTGKFIPEANFERAKKVPRGTNYEIEHQLQKLRTRRSKLKRNPARLAEFNAINEQIKALEKQRLIAPTP